MATALSRIRRRGPPGDSRGQAAQSAATQPVTISIEPPFGGYTPDLPPALCNWGDGQRSVNGLVQTRGTLASPPGYLRFGASTLPLGSATPPAAGANIQPAVALFVHRDLATSPAGLRRYAVTANSTLGRLYELTGGAWTNIPYSGAGAGLTGGVGALAASTLLDAAYFALDNRLILTNGLDPVYRHTPGGASYTDFSAAVLNPFKARSVCSAFQRVLFLNTSESGTLFANRLRYTTTGASPSLSGTGAGFIDFDEVQGEGVAVRKLGNRVAAYFRRGIVLLRETGSLTPSPIARDYVAKERGLLGTFAVCEIARGLHFGIFNDGWFFLNEDGLMTQCGMFYVGDRAYSKWRDDFYGRLNHEEAHRIQVAYNSRRHQVYVLWPSSGQSDLDEYWVYDINTDTAWPISSSFAGKQPNVLSFLAVQDDTETWNSITETWESETRIWDELTSAEGASTIVVGTRDGLVLGEDSSVYAVDGTVPSYEFLSARSDLDLPSVVKEFERLDVHYEIRIGMSAPNINFIFDTDAGTGEAPRQVLVTKQQLAGATGSRVVQYATSRLTGHTLSWGVSGQAPVMIHKVIASIVPQSRTYRKNV